MLYHRVERFDLLTSTWSDDQLSIVKDLTLEIWVPNLRCNAAHRMHRKSPICCPTISISCFRSDTTGGSGQSDTYIPTCPSCSDNILALHSRQFLKNTDIHVPGFNSPQSAQRSLPGTDRTRSWRALSLRDCWRLLIPTTIFPDSWRSKLGNEE